MTRRVDPRCCRYGRIRWARREASSWIYAIARRPVELVELHAVTLAALGHPLTESQHRAIRTAFAAELTRHSRRTGTRLVWIAVSELGRGTGRWHDHGIIAASAPIRPVELHRLYRDALAAAGLDNPIRTSCTPVRDLTDWCEYAFKCGRHARKAGALIASPIALTWGSTRTLYAGHTAIDFKGRTVTGKAAVAILARSPEPAANYEAPPPPATATADALALAEPVPSEELDLSDPPRTRPRSIRRATYEVRIDSS